MTALAAIVARVDDANRPRWNRALGLPGPPRLRPADRGWIEGLAVGRERPEDQSARYEEPRRAEAVDRALARVDKDDQQLVRELRSHERSLMQAHKALTKRRTPTPCRG